MDFFQVNEFVTLLSMQELICIIFIYNNMIHMHYVLYLHCPKWKDQNSVDFALCNTPLMLSLWYAECSSGASRTSRSPRPSRTPGIHRQPRPPGKCRVGWLAHMTMDLPCSFLDGSGPWAFVSPLRSATVSLAVTLCRLCFVWGACMGSCGLWLKYFCN